MQHRIKGELDGGPMLSVRPNHPIATRLWSEGCSYRTSVGRWAVIASQPRTVDPDGHWTIYGQIGVARFTSRSRAVAYARRWQRSGSGHRARVVRWRRWIARPQIIPVEPYIARITRLAQLLGLESL